MQENYNIQYRKANSKDAYLLAALRVQFLNEISDNENIEQSLELESELSKYFEQKLQGENIVIWIAEYRRKIIATSTMIIWQPPISYSGIKKNGRGYILNMYTLKAYRKRGVGTSLLKKLVGEAEQFNLEKVHLHATDDGIDLYKSIGFAAPKYPELVLNI